MTKKKSCDAIAPIASSTGVSKLDSTSVSVSRSNSVLTTQAEKLQQQPQSKIKIQPQQHQTIAATAAIPFSSPAQLMSTVSSTTLPTSPLRQQQSESSVNKNDQQIKSVAVGIFAPNTSSELNNTQYAFDDFETNIKNELAELTKLSKGESLSSLTKKKTTEQEASSNSPQSNRRRTQMHYNSSGSRSNLYTTSSKSQQLQSKSKEDLLNPVVLSKENTSASSMDLTSLTENHMSFSSSFNSSLSKPTLQANNNTASPFIKIQNPNTEYSISPLEAFAQQLISNAAAAASALANNSSSAAVVAGFLSPTELKSYPSSINTDPTPLDSGFASAVKPKDSAADQSPTIGEESVDAKPVGSEKLENKVVNKKVKKKKMFFSFFTTYLLII